MTVVRVAMRVAKKTDSRSKEERPKGQIEKAGRAKTGNKTVDPLKLHWSTGSTTAEKSDTVKKTEERRRRMRKKRIRDRERKRRRERKLEADKMRENERNREREASRRKEEEKAKENQKDRGIPSSRPGGACCVCL